MSIFEYDEEAVRKMLREEAFEEGVACGEAKGIQQGEQRMLILINKMLADNMAEQVSRLSEDAEFLQEMYERYKA